MKLKALALALVLTGFGAVQASAQNFHLGLEAGANFDNFIGTDVSASSLTSSRLGLVGGAYLTLQFGSSFAIQPEVLYAQKGGQDTASNTYQLDYIEIPVLFKLSLGTPIVNPGLLLGPTFNMNILAKVVNGGASSDITNVNQTDIGVMGGVVVDIDKFSVSGRYELGLTDITTASKVQNGTITVLVGYSFM